MSGLLKVSETLHLEFALMCEDVREEVGNKFSAIGIFGGDITVAAFPANIRAAFLLMFFSSKGVETDIRVRLNIDDKQVLEMQAVVNFETAGHANMIIPMGAVHLDKPGRIALEVSSEEGVWVEAVSKEVMKQESPGTLPTPAGESKGTVTPPPKK